MAVVRRLVLLLAVCSVALGTELWEYWGHEQWNCAARSDQMAAFNVLQYGEQPVWVELYTLTFSDLQAPIGGMINIWYISAGPVIRSMVNPFLTDGLQSPPALVVEEEQHAGRFFTASPDGGLLIQERGQDPFARVIMNPNNSMSVSGRTERASWDLLVDFVKKESWCVADHASEPLGLSPPQFFSWNFYMPRAIITGRVTIDGVSRFVTGYGESDHPFGQFVPFDTWSGAYLSNGFSTFYFVDFSNGVGSFARVETSAANITVHDVQWSADGEPGNPTRPFKHTLVATGGGVTIRAQWQPTVPGLRFDGTVQDVMAGSVSVCSPEGPCDVWSGRGWTEKVVTGTRKHSSATHGLLSLLSDDTVEELLRHITS